MTTKKEILYPLFIECCRNTEDPFWINIFEELSYGKSPYGTYISKGYIICNQKKKEFNYKLEYKSHKKVFNELQKIFRNNLGLLSNKDKYNNDRTFKRMKTEIDVSKDVWSEVKKKNMKDTLIELFVIKMSKKHDLTCTQGRSLISVIHISMMLKNITSKHIHMDGGDISAIDGITFSNQVVNYDNNLLIASDIQSSKQTEETKTVHDIWTKYILDLSKNYDSINLF